MVMNILRTNKGEPLWFALVFFTDKALVPTTRTVDVHIVWLREKLESNPRRPQFIATIRGLGYKFIG
jgi:DNA-binding response OmpR family regulator